MKAFVKIARTNTGSLLAAALLVLYMGCDKGEAGPLVLSFEDTQSPAAEGSGEPNLFVDDDGRLYMSWIERLDDGKHTLKFSIRDGDDWTEPGTVATGDNWFVNWADFPSLVALANGSLAAHWLAKNGKDPYAYDVHLAYSRDGVTWTKPFKPHTDGTESQHGFVSMLPWSSGRVLLVWLDGRKYADAQKTDEEEYADMTLRTALMDPSGRLYNERSIDERVCSCCQTSAARTTHGAIVAYRDRSSEEVRDISVARFYKGEWLEPQTVSADGWTVAGCPVNGPSLAARDSRVALAWFTNANDEARVKVVFSEDEGQTFGPPTAVDDGEPSGRVDIVMLRDGSVLVS